MKLIYISNTRIPSTKANSYQSMQMCAAFKSCINEVEMWIPAYWRGEEECSDADPFQYYGVSEFFYIRKLPVLDLKCLYFINDKAWARLKMVSFSYCVAARLKFCDEDDIVYTRDAFTLRLLCFLKSQNIIRNKIYFEAHVFTQNLLQAIKRAQGVVCITSQLERMHLESGIAESQIMVAHDAVNISKYNVDISQQRARLDLGLPSERKIIGYIGRFHTLGMEKGVPELIKSMAELQQEFRDDPPLLLCVGGPMDRLGVYLDIAEQNGVHRENLLFHEGVPPGEVPMWIKSCDVVTIPWNWNDFAAYYTSPMKLFEYMASGVPIVASRLPALCEILTHKSNALCFEAGNAVDLACAIAMVLREQELAGHLSSQAYRDVQNYTWHKRAERVVHFMRESCVSAEGIPIDR